MKLRDIFIREPAQTRPLTKAEQRVASLPTHDLVPWAEQCLFAVGRAMSDWSRDAARPELLVEAVEATETLQVVLAELQNRAVSLATTKR